MNQEEYRERFISHLVKKGIDQGVAKNEYAAWAEMFFTDGNPEEDAEEAISAWQE